ncbi:MAG TPA: TonB C-terminal domain-containing protein [Steroidobacteraceae bacterium]|nr:TonB C-terminal domain-containing protein [Steroidobacteraceae bacterium]
MKRKSWLHRNLPILALGLMVTFIGTGAFALLRSFLRGGSPHPQQVVQQIQLIRPPPPPPNLPPPPPPPPEEKVHIPTPEKAPPTPDHPQPSQQLGLDAKGGSGSDAFGLVGRPGGQDITGEGGAAFAWYGGVMKDAILHQLDDVPELRSLSYIAEVSLWISGDGTIQRVAIAKSSGDPKIDRLIESSVSQLRIPHAPPPDMPLPVTIKLSTQG